MYMVASLRRRILIVICLKSLCHAHLNCRQSALMIHPTIQAFLKYFLFANGAWVSMNLFMSFEYWQSNLVVIFPGLQKKSHIERSALNLEMSIL